MSLSRFVTDEASDIAPKGAFQRNMESIFSLGVATKPSPDHPMRSQVVAYHGQRLQFASLRLSPHSTFQARAPKNATPRFLLTVNKEGPKLVSQDGRESEIGPNEIFLIDLTRPFHIESGHVVSHATYIPTATLRALAPRIDDFTATRIESHTGPAAMLRVMLDELVRMAPDLDEAGADTIADILPRVAAAVFESLVQNSMSAQSRQRLLHLQRIKRFVRENLADQTLSADSIARGVNLSVRYVYEVFAAEEQALMKWVWSERLERCRRDLETPALCGRSIGEVAFSWGFTSLAHFSRSFAERYETSPRLFRKTAFLGSAEAANFQNQDPSDFLRPNLNHGQLSGSFKLIRASR